MPEPTLKDVAEAHASGRIAEARALCESVLAHSPHDGDALMWSGLIAMGELRWPEAISAFEQALAIRADPSSLANVGACYLKVGRLEEAERSLRRATELKPNLYGAYIGLATALHGLRRFDEALARLDHAAGLPQSDHKVELRRGCTLTELRRYDDAQRAFERAVAGSASFVYPRLVQYDRTTFDSITAARLAYPPPQVAVEGNASGVEGIVVISCDPPYARKYGAPFLRSYAAHARAQHLLHLHIPDPDDRIVDEMREIARTAGLANIAITTERAPFPGQHAQQRRAYYACARLLHLPHWLERYAVPMLLLDVDFIVERPLDILFESSAGSDACLNARHPIDSPWLDVIANVIVANPTPRSRSYFAAVASYALGHLEREAQAWLVDQAALFCVLRMFERYGEPPAIRWLPQAHQSGLWHIGHLYDHLLNLPRFRRWSSTSQRTEGNPGSPP